MYDDQLTIGARKRSQRCNSLVQTISVHFVVLQIVAIVSQLPLLFLFFCTTLARSHGRHAVLQRKQWSSDDLLLASSLP